MREGDTFYVGLENIESNTGRLIGNTSTPFHEIKSTKTCFEKGDLLYGKLRPNLNKVYLAERHGICPTDILVYRFESEKESLFYLRYFLSKEFNDEVLRTVSGLQLPRTSATKMETIQVPAPTGNELDDIVAKIQTHENTIAQAQQVIENSAARKRAILKQYL